MGLVYAVTVVLGSCMQLSYCIQRTRSLKTHTVFGSYKHPLKIPEPWGEGCDLNVTLRAEHPAVSYSLHDDQLLQIRGVTVYSKRKIL